MWLADAVPTFVLFAYVGVGVRLKLPTPVTVTVHGVIGEPVNICEASGHVTEVTDGAAFTATEPFV